MRQPDRVSLADRVYSATWQDGSIDLFAGLAAAGIGVAWSFDLVALGAVIPAMAVPLWMAFRRWCVEPRLGRVRFTAERRRRMTRAQVALIAAGCGALVLAVVAGFALESSRPEWRSAVVPALPGALVGIAGGLSALMFAMPRFAWYAGLFVLGGVVVALIGAEPGWGLIAAGLITAVAGGALLLRFVRQFPPLRNELE